MILSSYQHLITTYYVYNILFHHIVITGMRANKEYGHYYYYTINSSDTVRKIAIKFEQSIRKTKYFHLPT